MHVNVIKYQGFCQGVIKALDLVYKTIENPETPKPIYLLGRIIHNDFVVDKIRNLGVIILEDKSKSRYELLSNIDKGTVIFSAHGVEPKVYELALNKGLNIIDASCTYVLKTQNNIKKHLALNYDVIYIGTHNHPESEAVMGISDKINLITCLDDISKLNINNELIYATNQTTLSSYDLIEFKNLLFKKYPNLIYDDKICGATTIRQKAIIEQPLADLCIVVGDKFSSNTKKLVSVSENVSKIKTIHITDLSDLDINVLKNIKSVNVTSGASTPKEITDEVIDFLRLYE